MKRRDFLQLALILGISPIAISKALPSHNMEIPNEDSWDTVKDTESLERPNPQDVIKSTDLDDVDTFQVEISVFQNNKLIAKGNSLTIRNENRIRCIPGGYSGETTLLFEPEIIDYLVTIPITKWYHHPLQQTTCRFEMKGNTIGIKGNGIALFATSNIIKMQLQRGTLRITYEDE